MPRLVLRDGWDPSSVAPIVVSSDLSRARETAEIIAAELGLRASARCTPTLRERAYGEAEGVERRRVPRAAGATGTAPRSPAPSRGRTCARAACALWPQVVRDARRDDRAGRGIRHRRHPRRADPRAASAMPPAASCRRRASGSRTAPRTRCCTSASGCGCCRTRTRPPLGSAAWQPRDGRRVHRGVPARGRRAAAADPRGHRGRGRAGSARARGEDPLRHRRGHARRALRAALRRLEEAHRPLPGADARRAAREPRSRRTAPRRTRSSSRTPQPVPYELIGEVTRAIVGPAGRRSVRRRLTARQHRPRVAQHRLVDHAALVGEHAALALARQPARRAPSDGLARPGGTPRG